MKRETTPWDNLSLQQKSEVMQEAISNGVYDYSTIISRYNDSANQHTQLIEKVNKSNADFVQRLKDPNREYIENEDGTISTHSMSYAEDDEGAIVYPEVQSTENGLTRFNVREAINRAIERGDTLRMSVPDAEWFTTNYKEYYPKGRTFGEGGDTDTQTVQEGVVSKVKNTINNGERYKGIPVEEWEGLYNMFINKDGEFQGFGGGRFDGAGASAKIERGEEEGYDYVRNTPIIIEESFSQAFAKARKQGLKEFVFNGKKYTTEVSKNPKYTKKETQEIIAANIREVLDKNRNTIPDSTRVEPYIGQIPGEYKREKKADGGYLDNLTTKPFSYEPVPIVRYNKGGHLYDGTTESTQKMDISSKGRLLGESISDWKNRVLDFNNYGYYEGELSPAVLTASSSTINEPSTTNQKLERGIMWDPNNFLTTNNIANTASKKERTKEELYPKRNLLDSLSRYSQNWSSEDVDYLYGKMTTSSFSPNVLDYVFSTESKYNPYVKSTLSTAIGLGQLTKPTLKELYGEEKGEAIYKEYKNKSRSRKDIIDDVFKYLEKIDRNITTERDNMSYGRLKVNFLAPNASLDSVISDIVYENSLTPVQKLRIKKGKSTYRDLMDIYNREFNRKHRN